MEDTSRSLVDQELRAMLLEESALGVEVLEVEGPPAARASSVMQWLRDVR